jgi:two-component system, OmpR family, phosphate regulon response regulator PhoB
MLTNPITVLIVEDDSSTAEMYQLKLRSEGYRVVIARDGETALSLAEEAPPDLILLDIALPRMDGLELLAKLRSREATRGIPVAVLSNYAEPEMVERGRRLGALEWLDKTKIMPAELSRRVASWTIGSGDGGGPPSVA